MAVSIGTFNLNNLFSRFNFTADLSTATGAAASVDEQTTFSFSDPHGFKIRKYQGKLVKGKDPADTAKLVERIKRIDLDVLAIQEAEDIDTLRAFVRDDLDGLYPHVVLVEGNDPRLIDVGLLSKLPLGAITSWQTTPDPAAPSRRLFSRDLLQVEVLSATGKARLLTVFVNHLKSHFVPFTEPDPVAAGIAADQLRERQVNARDPDHLEPDPAEQPLRGVRRHERPARLARARPVRRPDPARPAQRPHESGRDAAAAGREPAAGEHRLDGAVQAAAEAGRAHADGPGLAQPRAEGPSRRARSSTGARGSAATAATTTLRGSRSTSEICDDMRWNRRRLLPAVGDVSDHRLGSRVEARVSRAVQLHGDPTLERHRRRLLRRS